MANALYTKAKQALLDGAIDLNSDTLKLVFVTSDYSPNLATDDALADIDAGYRVATSGALQSPTITDGVFDADDITTSSVSGSAITYVVLYDDTHADDILIMIWDTLGGDGLPLTPNGGDIKMTFDATGIFKLD